MRFWTSRAARRPLALTLIAVAACADDPPTTGPSVMSIPATRQALDGNVILVTDASGANVPGSLPWAVSVANGTSVIQFADSLAGDTITLDATLEAFPYITIVGPTTKGITLTTATGAGRVVRLRQGGVLRNLTISGGTDGTPGSAISTQGPLLLEHATVSNNHGGMSAIHGHEVTLVNSTVSNNSGSGPASGISIASNGTLTVVNSTVAHNEGAPGIGWVTSPGGPPVVTLRNSIVTNNGSGSRNCESLILYEHHGMNIASDSTCGISAAMLVADPMLLGLTDNGGPTATHALDHRSPAVNGGVNCNVTVDQRYVARGASCDIGAFEFTDFTVVTLTIDANAVTGASNGGATVTGTVRCSRAGDEFGVLVELEQRQKAGKTTTVIRGSGSTGIGCTTSAQAWSVVVTPTTGAFVAGSASASARTFDPPVWTAPASVARAVKLVRPPRR